MGPHPGHQGTDLGTNTHPYFCSEPRQEGCVNRVGMPPGHTPGLLCLWSGAPAQDSSSVRPPPDQAGHSEPAEGREGATSKTARPLGDTGVGRAFSRHRVQLPREQARSLRKVPAAPRKWSGLRSVSRLHLFFRLCLRRSASEAPSCCSTPHPLPEHPAFRLTLGSSEMAKECPSPRWHLDCH